VTGAAVAALAVLLAGSGPAPELERIDRAWDAAVAARDEAGFLSRVAPDSVFAGAALQVGRDAIRERWSRYLTAGGPTLRWKPTASGIAPSGDLGWTIGDATYAWAEKGVPPTLVRYVTVWARGPSGRWVAALDAPLEPAPWTPSARSTVRRVASRDGRLEASIGTFVRDDGVARSTGTFLVVRERDGDSWRVLLESEIPSPPPS
jgi:ketosteroid isomerase-like protein